MGVQVWSRCRAHIRDRIAMESGPRRGSTALGVAALVLAVLAVVALTALALWITLTMSDHDVASALGPR